MLVLISESDIGIHSIAHTQDCEVIPFVFIPQIKKTEEDKYYVTINIKNERILELVKHYQTNKEVSFFLGYDLDENGELMAHAVKNFLIENGIQEIDIFRTPLTEEGYLAVSDFLNIDSLLKFHYVQRKFQAELKEKKIPTMGILELLSIGSLDNKKGKELDLGVLEEKKLIDTNKTSTITFVVNNLQKEEI